ncbi:MAG TPA: ABC-F family ATP-binding cassette domain-containing protein [Tepidisphaeraceae bacterium]
MPLIAINNLEKVLGDRLMFDKLAFAIEKGERVGLIGNNGEGKTTLFKMMIGEMNPDVGEVSVPRGTKVGYLKQDVELDPANTLIDEAELAFAELHAVAHDMRELEHKMAEVDGEALEKVLAKYEQLQHDFEDKGGYAFRHKLEATLLGVGLPESMWETNVEKLSGGQRSRLALAKILIAEPELLLLDEPTNHLDLMAIEWLEDYLLAFNGAVLVISHDRYMLDRVCTKIAWLTQKKIKTYPGNFTKFLELKELEEISQARAHELQQKDIAKQEEFIRRFGAGQRAREAQGRLKKLERFKKSDAIVSAVQGSRAMSVKFNNDARAGDQLLRVEGLAKSFGGKNVWRDLAFNVKPGERIGIIGPNGSGKTTLLKSLLGEMPVDDGEIRWGTNLDIGYYDQRLDEFDPNNTILEECHDGMMPERKVRDVLGSLLFSGDTVDKRMGDLSGGERARVALAQLMLEKPNVILLDEPTNHLDVQSAAALESTLSAFDGTLLIVSHDRYFLSQIVTRLLVLEPNGLIDFEGTFDEWQRKTHAAANAPKEIKAAPKAQASKPTQQSAKPKPKSDNGRDNPYARKFGRLSVKDLEKQIAETESEIGMTQMTLSRVARDPSKSKSLTAELNQLSGKLKELEAEYFLREA